MSKKLLGYLGFFIVLVIAFYFFLFRDNDFWRTKLPEISEVKPFRFTTQDGTQFTEKDMLGKVSVVEYFFTTCKGICPKMNNNMKKVYEDFHAEPDFQIVSHT